MSRGPLLKQNRHQWALTNFGRLIVVKRTKREAIVYAENWLGLRWEYCKSSCELRKVTISEGWS